LQLTVELNPVFVSASDDQRLFSSATQVFGDARRDDGVPRQKSEDSAAMISRVIAPRLVVSRHARPCRHRCDQRQPSGCGRLDCLRYVTRAIGAEEGQRTSIASRDLTRSDRVVDPVAHVPDLGSGKSGVNGVSQGGRKDRLDRDAADPTQAMRLCTCRR